MGISRQEYWSGLPCPPPGNLPYSGIEPTSLTYPALTGGFFTTSTIVEAQVMVSNIKYPPFLAGPTWSSEKKSAMLWSTAGEGCGRRLCSHVVTYPLKHTTWAVPQNRRPHNLVSKQIGLSYFPLSSSLPFTLKWKCKAYTLSYTSLGKFSMDPTEDPCSGDDNRGPQVGFLLNLSVSYVLKRSQMYTEWIFRSWIYPYSQHWEQETEYDQLPGSPHHSLLPLQAWRHTPQCINPVCC